MFYEENETNQDTINFMVKLYNECKARKNLAKSMMIGNETETLTCPVTFDG
jgi:hypothetical protein